MGAVGYRAWADLRRSVRAAAGIAVLVAILGGLVLATVAGARRTASAYPRMLAGTNAAELLVSPPGDPDRDPAPFYDAVAETPGVRAVATMAALGYLPLAGSPAAAAVTDPGQVLGLLLGSVDGTFGYEVRRPQLSAGRLPAPEAVDEVLVSRIFVQNTGLGMGDVLDLVLVGGDVEGQPAARADDGIALHLEIVGVGTFPNEVVTFSELDEEGSLLVPPAVAALQGRPDWWFEGAFVDLHEGADVGAAIAEVRRLGDDDGLGTGGAVFVSDETAQAENVQDGMRPLAVALAAFAAAVGVVGLVVVGQSLARHTRTGPADLAALRSMGMRARQRVVVPLLRAGAIGAAGAVVAVAVAVALSTRFPIGPARVAEPDPGVDADLAVLLPGALLVAVAAVVILVPATVLRARRERAGGGALGRAVTGAAGAAGLSAPAVQGVRLAFGTGADGSPPARSAVVVATLAVAAVLGSAAFARGLTDLVDHPLRYGQGWDVLLDSSFAPAPVGVVLDRYGDDDRVEGIAVGNYGEVEIGGAPVPAVELATVRGTAGITLLDGALADEPGEIVLGGEVLDRLGAGVGDEVEVDVGGSGTERWRVVGRAVFPRLSRGSFDGTGLGVGAQVAPGPLPIEDAEAIIEDAGFDPALFLHEDGRTYAFVAVALAGDQPGLEAELAELADESFSRTLGSLEPTTIRDLDRVRDVPAALAGVLALVAVTALAYQLSSSVRERRRELALLRTLGFSTSQLRRTIVAHGLLLAVIAVAIGVPLGLAVGRVTWRAFAARLHVEGVAPMPWPWLAGAVPAAVAVACALSLAPAIRAGRLRPATVLRDEVRA